MSAHAYITNDMCQMINCNLIRLDVVKSHRHIFEEDYTLKLIEIYGTLLFGYIKLEQFSEFDSTFHKLKSLNIQTNLEKATQFSKIYLYKFLYLLKKENFREGIELVKEFEEGLKKFESSIQKDDLLIVHYYICRIYFGACEFTMALEYSNYLLNHPFINYREDMQTYCCILNLIIHYELRNYDLLPYIIKSVHRFLFMKGKIYKFEKLILSFLKNLKFYSSERELGKRLAILKTEVLKLQEQPFEKNVFMYFEILSWMDRKIVEGCKRV